MSRRDPEFVLIRWIGPDLSGRDRRQRRRALRRTARLAQSLGLVDSINATRRDVAS